MYITNKHTIGTAPCGADMVAWTEVESDGSTRSFEEYATTCRLPSLDMPGHIAYMGLTLVRETNITA